MEKNLKALTIIILVLAGLFLIDGKKGTQNAFPPQFDDTALFLTPIKTSKQIPSEKHITGITVPHHLLASDLIADAFIYASRGKYSKIILISPDHFNSGESSISVSSRDFLTVFGNIETDTKSVKTLLENQNIKEGNFFYREHGIGAELPFVKYFFQKAKIVAITVKEGSRKEEVDTLVKSLESVIDKSTLIVQSTDFSHYLTKSDADKMDTKTISVISGGAPEDVWSLNEPNNLDSVASQYVQEKLQKDILGGMLKILSNKNSQDYTKEFVDRTTSYIVQAYEK